MSLVITDYHNTPERIWFWQIPRILRVIKSFQKTIWSLGKIGLIISVFQAVRNDIVIIHRIDMGNCEIIWTQCHLSEKKSKPILLGSYYWPSSTHLEPEPWKIWRITIKARKQSRQKQRNHCRRLQRWGHKLERRKFPFFSYTSEISRNRRQPWSLPTCKRTNKKNRNK